MSRFRPVTCVRASAFASSEAAALSSPKAAAPAVRRSQCAWQRACSSMSCGTVQQGSEGHASDVRPTNTRTESSDLRGEPPTR